MQIDGAKALGLTGWSGLVNVLWINGGNPSKLSGDAQGADGIAAPSALRVYEAWVQYNFPGERWSVLAGRYDLNTEFYQLASGALFLNNSFGVDPTFGLSGFGGPSIFPDTALGLRLAYRPDPDILLRTAILTGAPIDSINDSPPPFSNRAGVLMVGEADFFTRSVPGGSSTNPRFHIGRFSGLPPYDDKIAFGAWYGTAGFNDLSSIAPDGRPIRRQGEGGAYAFLDRLLLRSGNLRLSAFLQVGVADQTDDRFGSYFGAGLVATGLFPGRPLDQTGIAAAVARNSSHYARGQQQDGLPVAGSETAIEATYQVQITSRVAVQPDVQFVIYPNTNPRLANATIVQLRFAVRY